MGEGREDRGNGKGEVTSDTRASRGRPCEGESIFYFLFCFVIFFSIVFVLVFRLFIRILLFTLGLKPYDFLFSLSLRFVCTYC